MKNRKVLLNFAISSITAVFLLFSHIVPVSAQTTTIRIYPENQSVSVQQNFIVSVVVDPGTPIAGAQFDLIFDPSLMRVVSVSEGGLFSQGGANTYFKDPTINNETGRIAGVAGVILGPNTVSSSGTLAIIYMCAKSTEGSSTLTLENVKIVDENGVAVPTTIQTGTVTISEAPSDNIPPGGGGASPTILIIGGVVLILLGIITVYMLTRKPGKWELRP